MKAMYNKFGKFLGVAGGVSATGSVFAAVPADVTTAIGTMATDSATVATAVLVAIIGVVAIKFIRKGL